MQAARYVDAASDPDMDRPLVGFQEFFRQYSEHWFGRFQYEEASALLQAYLMRVVNGGGCIEREYGLGRGRTDMRAFWPPEGGARADIRGGAQAPAGRIGGHGAQGIRAAGAVQWTATVRMQAICRPSGCVRPSSQVLGARAALSRRDRRRHDDPCMGRLIASVPRGTPASR